MAKVFVDAFIKLGLSSVGTTAFCRKLLLIAGSS